MTERKSRAKNKADLKVHPWTLQEDAFLLEHYHRRGPHWCSEAMQAMGYKRTRSAVDNRGDKLGLRYIGPPLGRRQKGHIPHNKGQKMRPETYKQCAPTMFKKGSLNGAAKRKHKPVGTETFVEYWMVKVAEGRWVQKHRLLWEQHNGTIPAGHLVVFRDGNPHNIILDNLELITRAEAVRRNRWGAGPSEYSLISGRAAMIRLNKRGIGDRAIRQNPELLEAAKAETLLQLTTRKHRHSHATNAAK